MLIAGYNPLTCQRGRLDEMSVHTRTLHAVILFGTQLRANRSSRFSVFRTGDHFVYSCWQTLARSSKHGGCDPFDHAFSEKSTFRKLHGATVSSLDRESEQCATPMEDEMSHSVVFSCLPDLPKQNTEALDWKTAQLMVDWVGVCFPSLHGNQL